MDNDFGRSAECWASVRSLPRPQSKLASRLGWDASLAGDARMSDAVRARLVVMDKIRVREWRAI